MAADSDRLFRDSLIVTSLDGHILSWSRGAEALFGWRESEAIGRPYVQLVDPRHHAIDAQCVAEVAAGHCVRDTIVKQVRSDAAVFSCLQTLVPMRDATGRVTAVQRILFDLSSVQEAARAVRRALTQVREAASCAADPVGRGLVQSERERERERTRAEYLKAVTSEAQRLGELLDELVDAAVRHPTAELAAAQ
jgi:PAS domain S-box-containing protein